MVVTSTSSKATCQGIATWKCSFFFDAVFRFSVMLSCFSSRLMPLIRRLGFAWKYQLMQGKISVCSSVRDMTESRKWCVSFLRLQDTSILAQIQFFMT